MAGASGSEVSKILEERILGTETGINLEETGKVIISSFLSFFFLIFIRFRFSPSETVSLAFTD